MDSIAGLKVAEILAGGGTPIDGSKTKTILFFFQFASTRVRNRIRSFSCTRNSPVRYDWCIWVPQWKPCVVATPTCHVWCVMMYNLLMHTAYRKCSHFCHILHLTEHERLAAIKASVLLGTSVRGSRVLSSLIYRLLSSAPLLLRWPRNLAKVKFSLSIGGPLVNAINHIVPRLHSFG